MTAKLRLVASGGVRLFLLKCQTAGSHVIGAGNTHWLSVYSSHSRISRFAPMLSRKTIR